LSTLDEDAADELAEMAKEVKGVVKVKAGVRPKKAPAKGGAKKKKSSDDEDEDGCESHEDD
jgi:hypothetical protein